MLIARDLPLSQHTYAVVDIETSGLSSRTGDKICEVAVVVARGGRVIDTLQTLVNPQKPISRGAAAVNGISDSMVRSAPTFRQIAPNVLNVIEGAVLVAHNASFDLSFISAELRSAGHNPPDNPVVDTLALARRFYTFPSNRLGDVARSLGIRTERKMHRALADAEVTWEVLKRFLWDLQAQGVTTLDDLIRRQGSLTAGSGWRMSPPLMEWEGSEFCPIQGLPPIIEQAVRMRTPLRIKYTGSDGRESERVVQPRKITLREQATYLVAYCHLKHEERTFRLDRTVVLCIESAIG